MASNSECDESARLITKNPDAIEDDWLEVIIDEKRPERPTYQDCCREVLRDLWLLIGACWSQHPSILHLFPTLRARFRRRLAAPNRFKYLSSIREKRRAKERSDAIDAQIRQDARISRNECTILVLGSPGSGKSTVVDQMKIVHGGGLTRDERMSYRIAVWQTLLESAQAFIWAMHELGLDCVLPVNKLNAARISSYAIPTSIDARSTFVFPVEITEAICGLWDDPITVRVMDLIDRAPKTYLVDNAIYFFTQVTRLGNVDFTPTERDVLNSRQRMTGVTETRINQGRLGIRLIDVGAHSTTRKWMPLFEGVTSIIFCVALSDYDQVDKRNRNCLMNSLQFFYSVVNSRWFSRTSVILLLTKVDLFKRKLAKVPLSDHFPEYTGGADRSKAVKYILRRYMQMNTARLSVYPHVTETSRDPTFCRLVFAAVRESILHNALRDSGLI